MNTMPLGFLGALSLMKGMTNEERESREVARRTALAQKARDEHDAMVKNPPSKQALKHFFTERAGIFLATHEATNKGTRKERRLAARELGKKFATQVKAQKDEEIAAQLAENEDANLRIQRRGVAQQF